MGNNGAYLKISTILSKLILEITNLLVPVASIITLRINAAIPQAAKIITKPIIPAPNIF
jgi:hypothetical protein